MGKLIRTKLKEKVVAKNKQAVFIQLSEKELEKELSKKLLEEILEFIKAPDAINQAEEMADILEVIDTYYKLNILDKKTVSKIKAEKFCKRGGFVEGIYWEK